jgi:hypothetical protein
LVAGCRVYVRGSPPLRPFCGGFASGQACCINSNLCKIQAGLSRRTRSVLAAVSRPKFAEPLVSRMKSVLIRYPVSRSIDQRQVPLSLAPRTAAQSLPVSHIEKWPSAFKRRGFVPFATVWCFFARATAFLSIQVRAPRSDAALKPDVRVF